jgi:DNA repair exonuclease SbcCD ATPase subunit
MADWWEIFVSGSIGGSLLTAGAKKLLDRRKDRADVSQAEAKAFNDWQHAVADANAEMEKARQNSETWYAALQSVRAEVDAKVDAATATLRKQNAELTAAVESMARQLDQRTVDQAEVEWARMRNSEYEAMKAELTQLRAEVQQVPHLRAEVARLTTLLEETAREQRLDHEALRKDLDGGTNNG